MIHPTSQEMLYQTPQPLRPALEYPSLTSLRRQSSSSDAVGGGRHSTVSEQGSPIPSPRDTLRERSDDEISVSEGVPLHIVPAGGGNGSSPEANASQLPDHSPETTAFLKKERLGIYQKTEIQKILKSSWWWWEIMAMILGIGCMAALVDLLIRMDGIPLRIWWYPIQPNSLIAVLTTITKTALMVPAASCISQLKWHYYQQPRPLVDLQLFDDASRGPWGSAVLVGRLLLRSRPLVAIGFAFVTVAALGVDPCAQQVLEFPLRSTSLTNATVALGRADAYFSKAFRETGRTYISKQTSDTLALQSTIINGVTGSILQPYFSCPGPASRCAWPDFSTLGVCVESANVTDSADVDCQNNNIPLNCTVSFPEMLDPEAETITMSWDPGNTGGGERSMLFQSLFNLPDSKIPYFGTFTAVNSKDKGIPRWAEEGRVPPPVEVFYSKFAWCVRKYHNVTASPSGLISAPAAAVQTLEEVSRTEQYEFENHMDIPYRTFRANSTGEHYNISRMVDLKAPSYLAKLLTTIVWDDRHRPMPTDLLSLGRALYDADLQNVTYNVAESMTNMIRSDSPGDNFNATTVHGEASFDETYISVRWPWMILPLAETLLAAALLILSIVITRSQPLLKTSAIAYLIFGLRGWSDEELAVSHPQTAERLEDLSEKLVAQLGYDDQSQLRFKKVT